MAVTYASECKEDVDVRSSLLENPKSNGTAELSEQLESNSKRDSYANFEVYEWKYMCCSTLA